jgi:hypothetical protein
VYTAAADSDGDARPWPDTRGKAGCGQLFAHLGRNVGQTAVGEFLSDNKQAGKSHIFILAILPAISETRCAGMARMRHLAP